MTKPGFGRATSDKRSDGGAGNKAVVKYPTMHTLEKTVLSARELLIRETEAIPETLAEEVLDFLRFIKVRRYSEGEEIDTKNIDLSKTTFAQDWDSPEEDEAWKDL